jgi:aminoglycoside phosphotransferase (APT) family kinase protein
MPVHLPDQLIHGDLNPDNILVADHLPAAIIDFAPYWRPAAFALAVLAYWVGPYTGNAAILEQFRGIPAFDQMLLRAGLRMTLTQSNPGHAAKLEEYEQAAGIIETFVTNQS